LTAYAAANAHSINTVITGLQSQQGQQQSSTDSSTAAQDTSDGTVFQSNTIDPLTGASSLTIGGSTFNYDGSGNLTSITDIDGSTVQFNADGTSGTVAEATGAITNFSIATDANGNPTAITGTDSQGQSSSIALGTDPATGNPMLTTGDTSATMSADSNAMDGSDANGSLSGSSTDLAATNAQNLASADWGLTPSQTQGEFAGNVDPATGYDAAGYDASGYDAAGYNIYGIDAQGQLDPTIAANGGQTNSDTFSDGTTVNVSI
jgi:hypothetical protein